MASLFCGECGKSLEQGSQFCTSCGAKAPEIASEATTADQTSDGQQVMPNPTNYANQAGQIKYGTQSSPSGHDNQKRIILIALLAVIIVAILITGFFLVRRVFAGRQGAGPEITTTLPALSNDTEPAETSTTTEPAETTQPAEVIETTTAAVQQGNLPDEPTWLTPAMLASASAFNSNELDGYYTGTYVIREVENAAGLSDSLSNEQIFAFEEAWQQERSAQVEYEQSFLYLTIDLPDLGDTMVDGIALSLENQPFTDDQSEGSGDLAGRTFHYRVLTISEGDTLRLIGRLETTVSGDNEARFIIEFDVARHLTDDQSDDDTAQTIEDPSLIENQDPGLLPAYAYVPEAGHVYLFDVTYVSGEYGLEEAYVGKISNEVLSSVTVYLLDDETYLGEQYDFVNKDDGIYIVYDDEYESLWLPHDYEEFSYWETELESYMIIAVDQTLEVNGYTFDNCLMRSYEIPEADYFITEYLAPGHGVVYFEYAPGVPGYELLDFYSIEIETANSYLER